LCFDYDSGKYKVHKIHAAAEFLSIKSYDSICRNCFHEDGGVNAILEEVDVQVSSLFICWSTHRLLFMTYNKCLLLFLLCAGY